MSRVRGDVAAVSIDTAVIVFTTAGRTMKPTTDEMLEVIRQWAIGHYPAKISKRFRLYFVSDDPEDFVALPIPVVQASTLPAVEHEPSALADAILELLDTAGPLKASSIAIRLKRKYNGHFRTVIKSLRDAGEIVLNDQQRYSLPPEQE